MDVKRINEDDTFFSQTIRETIGVTAILTFLLESYPFNLFAELLLLPFLTFVVILIAVGERKGELKSTVRFLEWFVAIVMLGYLVNAFYQAYIHFDKFATLANGREFFIPIALSLMFLPFLYLLNVFMTYELVFAGVRRRLKDEALLSYAQKKAIFTYRFNLDFLRRWRRAMLMNDITSSADIDRILEEIRRIRELEKNPPIIPSNEGWSPYIAMNFLKGEGFKSKDYHRLYDDKWQSSSNYVKIENHFSLNNIVYYVEGSGRAADELTLEANVCDAEAAEKIDEKFSRACCVLLVKALGVDAATTIATQIGNADTAEILHNGWKITLNKKDWQKPSEYQRDFIIKKLQ